MSVIQPHSSCTGTGGQPRRAQGWERSLGGLKQLTKKKNPITAIRLETIIHVKTGGLGWAALPSPPSPLPLNPPRSSTSFKDRKGPKECETLLERGAWMPSLLPLPAVLPSIGKGQTPHHGWHQPRHLPSSAPGLILLSHPAAQPQPDYNRTRRRNQTRESFEERSCPSSISWDELCVSH